MNGIITLALHNFAIWLLLAIGICGLVILFSYLFRIVKIFLLTPKTSKIRLSNATNSRTA